MRFFSVIICAALAAPFFAVAQVTPEQRATLETQLAQIQSEIKDNQANLSNLQTQRTSLERDVAIYDSKIQAAQLGIKQRNLIIEKLKGDIAQKQQGIRNLDYKVQDGEESLAQILRETRQIDDMTFATLALGGSLSEIFQEIDDFQAVQKALGNSFTRMATQRADLQARQQALEEQRQEEQDLLQLQVLQQNSLKTAQKEKQDLVASARGQESVYQQVIASKQQTAAQIESTLFALRDTKSISFGNMYAYAKEASLKTNVRPALILGILSEESNLGQNVGSGTWRVDMKSPRDTDPFAQITVELGLNPDSMPVSKKPWYGWGGAMGPAQFIPSTWQLYKERIAASTGQNPPNPWDPRTATFAAAILMMDNGADQQTRAAERLAALRYLAGWKNATKSAYSFYGDDVMDLADKFQQQIDILGG